MPILPHLKNNLDESKKYILETNLCKNLSKEIKDIIKTLLEVIDSLSYSCHLPEFTDHSLPHLVSIIDRVENWTLKDGFPIYQNLSEAEISLLVISILIHDIGMLSQDLNSQVQEKTLEFIKQKVKELLETNSKLSMKEVSQDLGMNRFALRRKLELLQTNWKELRKECQMELL